MVCKSHSPRPFLFQGEGVIKLGLNPLPAGEGQGEGFVASHTAVFFLLQRR
jgi:hypothetical protein